MKNKLVIALFMLFFLLLPPHVFAWDFIEEPKKIIIPSVNISLPVKKARIQFDTWEVRQDAASFGETSTLPGNKGNVILFSHATPRLFGNIVNLKKGDTVHVFTESDWFEYEVISTEIVDPDQVTKLYARHEYELTLYTCYGPRFSQRFIVKAVPTKDVSGFGSTNP